MKRIISGIGAILTLAFVCAVYAAPPDDATFVQASLPKKLTVAGRQTIVVTMKNTGTTTWTKAAGYRLGSQNPGDNMTWSINRVELTADVPPQGTATFTFEIVAPKAAGTYNMQWKMVHENVTWFGVETPNVEVAVQ
jgi:Ig-like domain-containing protein